MMRVLDAVRRSGLPDAWVGAGAIRDLVWDSMHGAFDPSRVKDVDVAFLDSSDLSPQRDASADAVLAAIDPDVRWEAKNQAAVHTWFERRFGIAALPLHSIDEAVATWPETATCVAARLSADDTIEICAPYGLTDLLDGVWRRNPVRVTEAEAARRLAAKDVAARWPRVRIVT